MLTLFRVERIASCVCLVLIFMVGISCAAPAPAPGTPLAPATEPYSPTAAEAAAATATPSAEQATPTTEAMGGPAVSAEDVPRISVEELKALMDSGADITILDNRPRESYEMGHIKGAVSLPWSPAGLTEDDTALLRYGKLTVTYCDCGPGEADSADVALQLIQVYQMEDVKVLADPSIYGWIEAGYPTEP